MPGVALERVGQIAIHVKDLEAAVRFYRDVLGLSLLFETPGMAFFACGGTRILLGVENPHDQGTFLYFFVPDIDAAHRALIAAGVAFDAAPHRIARLPDRDVWLATFRDPEGTIHNLMSEVAPVSA